MSESYYDILGVSKSASKDEIKKAFRAKAKQHHPDKGGDEDAFKKINQAYEVLSDDNKKSQYDQFGHVGRGAGGGGTSHGGGFGGFDGSFGGEGVEDIFSSFFGGSNRQQRKQSGSDLESDVTISFKDAMNGTTEILRANIFTSCDTCNGAGGKDKKTCTTCDGKGLRMAQIQTPIGTINQTVSCDACQGEGSIFIDSCKDCSGEGRRKTSEKIQVEIPAGIADQETLRIRGKGEAGRRGSSSGDLYVHIHVKPDKKWVRDGYDIRSELSISVFDALLGGEFEVETFWGEGHINIPENTRDGQMLRIDGKGVRRDGRIGDHLVIIHHKMPKKISSKLRELLEEAKKKI